MLVFAVSKEFLGNGIFIAQGNGVLFIDGLGCVTKAAFNWVEFGFLISVHKSESFVVIVACDWVLIDCLKFID